MGKRGATHCKYDHEFTPENTYITPAGHRRCRACKSARRLAPCPQGHRPAPDNIYIDPQGCRRCLICKAEGRNTGNPPGRPIGTRSWSLPVDPAEFAAALEVVNDDPNGWVKRAACANHPKEAFFPGRGNTAALRAAIAVCAECPVRMECLALNIQEKAGVWGGTSEVARRRIRTMMDNYLSEQAA